MSTASHMRGGRAIIALLAAVTLTLATAPAAQAAKFFSSLFPSSPLGPGQGGAFVSPGDIVVNDPTVEDNAGAYDGWSYVVDRGSNRIQAFDSNKVFQFAIGRDVIAPAVNEQQLVSLNATAGSFTLTFDPDGAGPTLPATTSALAFNAASGTVQTALRALAPIGPTGVSVAKAPNATSVPGPARYFVTFTGPLAGSDHPQITADGSSLTGAISTSTITHGSSDPIPGDQGIVRERCTVVTHCKAGVIGSLGAEFNAPRGIDIDQETGHFFVRESDPNRRVQEFEPDGTFVRAFGWDVVQEGTGGDTAADQFETCFDPADCKEAGPPGSQVGNFALWSSVSAESSTGLAVAPPAAPNAGEVIVADSHNGRVQRFAVPTDPSQPVIPGAPLVFVPNPSVNGGRSLVHVAADSAGVIYAATIPGELNQQSIGRYDTVAGQFLAPIQGGPEGVLGSGAATSMEVDQQSGHLFVGRPATVGIVELDVNDIPEFVGFARLIGTWVGGLRIGAPDGSDGAAGIGINPESGELLVSAQGTGAANTGLGHRILVLDDRGVQPSASIELLGPIDVEASTATLRARVNPNGPTGFPTSYRFELFRVDLDTEWQNVAPDQLVPPDGEGSTDVFVNDLTTGLDPNTLYKVRVRTTRSPDAGTFVSPELNFTTDPAPPTAETLAPRQVTDASAQLIGRLGPGGLPGTYWFEWGADTGYGNVLPDPVAAANGGFLRLVGEVLAGLAPQSTYHYRLCAQNALSPTKVCGNDQAFVTRSSLTAPAGRAYELVTPADKLQRRGGFQAGPGMPDVNRFQGGRPAADGGGFLSPNFAAGPDPEAGHGFTADVTQEVRTRTAQGWRGEALLNVPTPGPTNVVLNDLSAMSADLRVFTTNISPSPWGDTTTQGFDKSAIRVIGDKGGPLGAGWYRVFDPSWRSSIGSQANSLNALIADSGERLVASNGVGDSFRNLLPADGGLAAEQLTPPQVSGGAPFLTDPGYGWRPGDLISECSGALGVDATELPSRVGSGVATDTIGARECAKGSPTSVRGAKLGSEYGNALQGTGMTAMSHSGARLFFMSPDPTATGSGQVTCATGPAATGAGTACPAQLFVRQYAAPADTSSGERAATVRWVSRSRSAAVPSEPGAYSGPMIAAQKIDLFGNGVSFEGASLDGSVVYFRTNAPLTPDDPNGARNPDGTAIAPPPGGVVGGTASPTSWDLYRYRLPASGDPGDGTLKRISGGPGQAADPNTNCTSSAADCGGTANGGGGVVRLMSGDGRRVYFVTAARIPAADNTRPLGGATDPTATNAQAGNATARNLYLYDDAKSGAAAYKFVAQLPFSSNGIAACAAFSAASGTFPHSAATPNRFELALAAAKCMRGSAAGDAVAFESAARLTPDDVDDAIDVYLYDAAADELVRLSAPPATGASPYLCQTASDQSGSKATPLAYCNADLGFAGGRENGGGGAIGLAATRHFNIAESPDGSLAAVYFESRLALAAGAAANDAMKVYEWRRDGRLRLISPANSLDSAFFTGNGRDGRDVFFWTEQRISPWEIDAADGDVYDASSRPDRLPDPPPLPPACDVLAGSCQLPPPAAPTAGGAASSSIEGNGNFVSKPPPRKPRCSKGKVRKGGKCVKKAKAKKAKRAAKKTRRTAK